MPFDETEHSARSRVRACPRRPDALLPFVLSALLLGASLPTGCVLFSNDLDAPQAQTDGSVDTDLQNDASDAGSDLDTPDSPLDTDLDTDLDAPDGLADADLGDTADGDLDGDTADGDLDGGVVDETLCSEGERRCRQGHVQDCAPDRLSWVDAIDCGDDLCQLGECVGLPSQYGDYCDEETPCDGDLTCHDSVCLTRDPQEPGFACTDTRECIAPGWCNSLGVCSLGLAGDDCASDDDCDHPAYVCGPERGCQLGREDSTCLSNIGCGEGFVCGPSGWCQRGVEGDDCLGSAAHCSPVAPICGPEGYCQDGGVGDPCVLAEDCVAGVAICVEGACTTPGAGADCSGGQSCPVGAPICGPDGLCQVGLRGDVCEIDDQCLLPLLCGPDGECHDGAEGDACETADHCADSAPICFDELCQDGGLGDGCRSRFDCGPTGPICGPSRTCRVGLEGDRCVATEHCGDLAPFCAEGRCRDGSPGDPCVTEDDCGVDSAICGPLGCQAGAVGEPCRDADDCGEEAPLCGPFGCQAGAAGDPCDGTADCGASAPLCGPTGCQDGDEGDLCEGSSDCAGGLAPFCAPDGQCHDGSAGDPCDDETQCLEAAPICGPEGCQLGSEGDSCLSETDCDDVAPYCGASGTCHDGTAGDDCVDESQCIGAVPLCGPSGCQEGLEGDPCVSWPDCDVTAPICGPDGLCHDGSAGDPCARDSHCQADAASCGPGLVCQSGSEGDACADALDCSGAAPICGPDGCQDGSFGDVCDNAGDCGLLAPFCGADGECHSGLEGEACSGADQCSPLAPLCSASGECQDGSEGDLCGAPSDCSTTAPICSQVGCQDGSAGDPCLDASHCAEATPVCDALGCRARRVADNYVELHETWLPTVKDAWTVIDLSVSPFDLPANAVVEVAVTNADPGNARWGGVRAVGSSLNRRLQLHEAEPDGTDVLVLHVQADGNARIEYFADEIGVNEFTVLGYWTSGRYIERYDILTASEPSTWEEHNLGAYGIGLGQIAEVVVANDDDGIEHLGGVRTPGSSLERTLSIHESESGGGDLATMLVEAGPTAAAPIELFADDQDKVLFHLVGFWSVAPGLYREAFSVLPGPSASLTWESSNLTGFGVPAGAVVQIAASNDFDGTDVLSGRAIMGLRRVGSALERGLNLQEAEDGGGDIATILVAADEDAAIEWFHEDVSHDHAFYLLGYWE